MDMIRCKRFKEGAWIAGILLAVLAVCFYDIVFLNKTFKVTTRISQAVHTGVYGQEANRLKFLPVIGSDAAVLEEPTLQFIRNSLRQGILPLWNPHQACGFPLIAIIETGIFFPLNLLVYLLPQAFAWDALILARFFLAGLFTYLFMRSLKFSRLPSLGAAVAFMLSGPMVLLQYWTVNVDILLPVLLMSINRLVLDGNRRAVALTAVSVALTFFAGHPEHIFLVNVYGVIFFFFRLLSLKKINFCARRKTFFLFLTAYLLGILLSAIVLLPFLSNLRGELWNGHPEGIGLRAEEGIDRWITFFLPHFFQKIPVTFDWAFAGWWGGYLGLFPLGLAFLSLFGRQKNGLNYFFAAMAFLMLAKIQGLFFINWIGYLPVFNVCRYAIHTPHLVAFSVAVCAGMGLRTVLAMQKASLKLLLFSVIIFTLIACHFIFWRASFDKAFAVPATVYAVGVLLVFQLILWLKDKKVIAVRSAAVFLIALMMVELFSYVNRTRAERFDSYPRVPYITLLKNQPQRMRVYGMFGAFSPNTGSAYGLDDLGIFNALLLRRYVAFVNRFIRPGNFVNDLRPTAFRDRPLMSESAPFLDLLNVAYIILPPESYLQRVFKRTYGELKEQFSFVYSQEVSVNPRQEAFPRVFMAYRAIFEPDKNKIFERVEGIKNQLLYTIVISGAPDMPVLRQLPPAGKNLHCVARVMRYTPNEVEAEVLTEDPGFLVLNDSFHPDWKAYVDGRPRPVYETDGLIRSVFVGKGAHRVKFVFAPGSFYAGCMISVAALFVILLLLAKSRKSPGALR